jgi:hypothetical protein
MCPQEMRRHVLAVLRARLHPVFLGRVSRVHLATFRRMVRRVALVATTAHSSPATRLAQLVLRVQQAMCLHSVALVARRVQLVRIRRGLVRRTVCRVLVPRLQVEVRSSARRVTLVLSRM